MQFRSALTSAYAFIFTFSGSYKGITLTSSGGYGRRVAKSIALGYIKPELAQPGTHLELEVLGKKLAAEVVPMPLYDPENKRIKS